jgi:ribonuclease HIII
MKRTTKTLKGTSKKTEPKPEEVEVQKKKIAHLDAEIAKAEEEGNESYLNYLLRIREQTIHVYEGGIVIFQSGTLPKY